MTGSYQPASDSENGPGTRDQILEVKDLRVHYETPQGDVIAVNGVGFDTYCYGPNCLIGGWPN